MEEKILIRFKPTKFEFEVGKKYGDELLLGEAENFEAVDKDYKPEMPIIEEVSIYKSIVDEEKSGERKRRRNRD